VSPSNFVEVSQPRTEKKNHNVNQLDNLSQNTIANPFLAICAPETTALGSKQFALPQPGLGETKSLLETTPTAAMGSSDIPPAHSPQWLIPLHTALLGIGVLLWDATYILMTRRALATRTYGMPLLALAANVSWEVVTVFYVCEAPLETFGFLFWLLLDVGLVYTTLKYGEENWRSSGGWSWVGRRIGWVFSALLVLGGIGNYWFASWWLAVEGRGSGTKAGKWWRGREGYDTTELAFWSAGVSQVVLSACSLSMLTSRGHSGGTSYTIW